MMRIHITTEQMEIYQLFQVFLAQSLFALNLFSFIPRSPVATSPTAGHFTVILQTLTMLLASSATALPAKEYSTIQPGISFI